MRSGRRFNAAAVSSIRARHDRVTAVVTAERRQIAREHPLSVIGSASAAVFHLTRNDLVL
jgi:hypothetical protein